MESIKQVLDRKPKKQVRLGLLLVSSAIIVATSLFSYNRISYSFPLAVGNTGQSALGPSTSAGVEIVYAIVVVAAIMGFGALLSIFGSLRAVSERLSEIVEREPPTGDSSQGPQAKPEWEEASAKTQTKETDDDILQALWRSKDENPAEKE